MDQLSAFVLDYVEEHLYSPDPNVAELARTQRWAALAHSNRAMASAELSAAISDSVVNSDRVGVVHYASLVESLAAGTGILETLETYARGMGYWAQDDQFEKFNAAPS
jgi:hypothetical protein